MPVVALQGAYTASKIGLEAMSEGLRRELTPFGIDVIVIKPGDKALCASACNFHPRGHLHEQPYLYASLAASGLSVTKVVTDAFWVKAQAVCMRAGPIESEIWGKVIDGGQPVEAAQQKKGASLFEGFLEKALAVSRRETAKPGFFFPASRVGEKVYAVSLPSFSAVLGTCR